jgi:Glycosyl hydrolases family 16
VLRAKAIDDLRNMVALWMIGYEDRPERAAEICICEIFGRDVEPNEAKVGMGVHPFGDPKIVDEFAAEPVAIDAREFHVYAAEWTPKWIEFFIDGDSVKTVNQSPDYPMQLMLSIYEFPPTAPLGRRARLIPRRSRSTTCPATANWVSRGRLPAGRHPARRRSCRRRPCLPGVAR